MEAFFCNKNFWTLFIFAYFNFIAWNYFGIFFIITSGFLFFFIKNIIKEKKKKSLFYIFLICLLFNLSSVFWLIQINLRDGIAALFVSSILMCIPLVCITFIYSKTKILLLPFLIVWLSYEILLTKWSFSWPWLTFGHVMGNQHYLIQWYSWFGVYSGTVWLIILGYILFCFSLRFKYRYILYLIFLITIPSFISLVIYSYKNISNSSEVNVTLYNPIYEEKERISNYLKLKKMYQDLDDVNLGEFVLTPEGFLKDVFPTQLTQRKESIYLNKIIEKYPNVNIFLGANLLNSERQRFNSSILISKDSLMVRTKKKYVPITEYINSPFGESYYTKNINDHKDLIIEKTSILPLVCYESVFSSFVLQESKDAKIIFLHASESFMENAYFGKKQYKNIIRLRAIETQKHIVTCSYKGHSHHINSKGDIVEYVNQEIQTLIIPMTEAPSAYHLIARFF